MREPPAAPRQQHRGRGTPAVCGGFSRQLAPQSPPVSAIGRFHLCSPVSALPAARSPSPHRAPTLCVPWPAGVLQSSLCLEVAWLLSSEPQSTPRVLRRWLQTPVSPCGRHLPGPPPESGHTHAAEGTHGPLGRRWDPGPELTLMGGDTECPQAHLAPCCEAAAAEGISLSSLTRKGHSGQAHPVSFL